MLNRRAFLAASAAAVAATPFTSTAKPHKPPHVVMLSGSFEYNSDQSLAEFAQFLESNRFAKVTLLKAPNEHELPGLEALDSADVALLFTRRLQIDGEPLERVQRYCRSGRPIVAVRTACHGFQRWLDLDPEILGGNYQGHYGKDHSTQSRIAPGAEANPILAGVEPFGSRASLYKTAPLAPDCIPLLVGKSPSGEHPTAWTRIHKNARVFNTSLGGPQDFECASFRRMLTNALAWTLNRDFEYPIISAQPPLRLAKSRDFTLTARRRQPSDLAQPTDLSLPLNLASTAAILCDVWDLHWCRGATGRVETLAPRMNTLVKTLRNAGIQIIHAPSETMGFYAGTPQRQRARLAPHATSIPTPLPPPTEPKLPIDDSDGGCDTDDSFYLAWTRQHPAIEIHDPDAVSDSGAEIERLLRQLQIKHILVMGVHTNMCILNRSFAIRSLLAKGFNPILVRDLTDTMYDPNDPPNVPHDRGTSLVIEHIERYLCPSITSDQVLSAL
jgi:nicotinamidase-related amidase/type 1 glutamine amidotransferase